MERLSGLNQTAVLLTREKKVISGKDEGWSLSLSSHLNLCDKYHVISRLVQLKRSAMQVRRL